MLITATTVQPLTLEVYEEVLGSTENVVDPRIGAELAGRVTRVFGYTGKKVRQGELLAEIDAQDFEIQQKAGRAESARLPLPESATALGQCATRPRDALLAST